MRKRIAAKVMPVTASLVYTVPRLMRMFPKTKRVQLRFSHSSGLVGPPGSSAFGIYNYAGNGLYIPDITGGVGLQPRGFDEAMAIYNNYQVLSSKISVVFRADEQTEGIRLGLYPQPSASAMPYKYFPFLGTTGGTSYSAAGGAQGLNECPGMMTAILSSTPENSQVLFERSVKTTSVLDNKLIANPDKFGTTITNPTGVWYWTLLWANIGNTAQATVMSFQTVIVYDVIFSNVDFFSPS